MPDPRASADADRSRERRPSELTTSELWLLRAGTEEERASADVLRAFERAAPAVVLGSASDRCRALAERLAAGWRARLVAADLGAPGSDLGERARRALASALEPRGETLLFVVELDELRALFAAALSIPLEAARALCVDPGRLVLLRQDAAGFVLRRSNVDAPERIPGTGLPGLGGRDDVRSGRGARA